mgnify:CR=1 FL=1
MHGVSMVRPLTIRVLAPADDPMSYHFLYPLRVVRRELRRRSVRVASRRVVSHDLVRGDLLLVLSSFFARPRSVPADEVVRLLRTWSRKVPVMWCDVWDSTGSVVAEVLPHVATYAKKQLTVDRSVYTRPLYGGRWFTDRIHREYGIRDSAPAISRPIAEVHLDRMRVSWNLGLGQLAPRRELWRIFLRGRTIGYERRWVPPHRRRTVDIHARMQWRYPRRTVGWQRERVQEALSELSREWRVSFKGRVSGPRFRRELAASRVVASPFGWGEICYRDFDGWAAGAAVVKPEMDAIETWPPLYERGVTYAPCAWDGSDARERLEELLLDEAMRTRIAREGQRRYRTALGREGMAMFCDHFLGLVESTLRAR